MAEALRCLVVYGMVVASLNETKMNSIQKLKLILLIVVLGLTLLEPAHAQQVSSASAKSRHTFGWQGEHFLLDGKPFQIISGDMHYAREPRQYWRDRMRKMKAMGLNTLTTYLFWNLHEPRPGQFDFTGNLDVAAYIRTAQEEGLWVIVRPGPYVCSEWEFGGLPAWLLTTPDMKVRSADPRFLQAVERYMKQVGRQLAPLQITRDGPVIMVQVENEYGSFGNDKVYLNGHNLGRYWRIGPQRSLFIPAEWLKEGRNEIIVLDLEPGRSRSVQGIKELVFETW